MKETDDITIARAIKRLWELGISTEHTVELTTLYSEPHRYYHNLHHVADLLRQIDTYFDWHRSIENKDMLILTAMYHDAIYDPTKIDNEVESANLFRMHYTGQYQQQIWQMIIDTKSHQPTDELSKVFIKMDLDILNRSFNDLMEYENKIFKEYQFVDWRIYRTQRCDILQVLSTHPMVNKDNQIHNLINYVKSFQPNIGVYAGSFNPFHKGHKNILEKSEKQFDKVIIAHGYNPNKGKLDRFALPESIIKYRQVIEYDALLTDMIMNLGYKVTLVRGLRNSEDLKYEMTQYRYLQDLMPDIKLSLLFCDREFEYISSSGIRQLCRYNKHYDYIV